MYVADNADRVWPKWPFCRAETADGVWPKRCHLRFDSQTFFMQADDLCIEVFHILLLSARTAAVIAGLTDRRFFRAVSLIHALYHGVGVRRLT